MKLSQHNILSQLKESNNYYLVNLLSGEADILTGEEANALKNDPPQNHEELTKKGYLVDDDDEKKLYRQKYLDFIDNRETDEIQLFFVPGYSCNFSCSYCFQKDYSYPKKQLTTKVIDAFFEYIKKAFAGRKKYITIFGGEPLLPDEHSKKTMGYFIKKANEAGLDIAIVTNGYHLYEYLDILKTGKIREIQVTLDGTKQIHNKRRPHKSQGASFDQIVKGIDGALQSAITINLRMIVDRENIRTLPKLARFSIDKKWTETPLFKTQLGRNYDLHFCQQSKASLYSRVELAGELYELIKEYPHILKFHKPAFSVSKMLFENGELPAPLFDSCPACKTEWAFDHAGRIFSCTATVGQENEVLGTFYPDVTLDEERVEAWQDRDVTIIEECKNCSLQLACGGGCGSVAKETKGSIQSADCRPIKELLAYGISLYQKKGVVMFMQRSINMKE